MATGWLCGDLNLDVRRGEFLTLLGPSGSGKTTTLMMLAGFETPTHGEIFLDEKPIHRVPAFKRNIGMVFQNYALFPHMTVGKPGLSAGNARDGRAGNFHGGSSGRSAWSSCRIWLAAVPPSFPEARLSA